MKAFILLSILRIDLYKTKKNSVSGKKILKVQGFLLEADCFKAKMIVK